jgi:beta-lactamase regulating signal transducer with metallopeptidase domain
VEHLLFEFALRAALIAAGTAAVLRVLRVRTAAARHVAWAGVVVLMMLLPVWTAWGPRASLRILPAAAAPAASRATAPAETFSGLALPGVDALPAPVQRPVWSWPACLACIYLLGVGVLLARLAVGTARAHMLVRRAVSHRGRLTSDSCAAPVTVGWLRPAVILPEGWRGWSEAQLDAVLTHEGEHARRRDPLMQWLALLNRAVFWFHPLAWWLEFRLCALAEEACDAAVLARGHDPFEYSAYLLEIARTVLRTGARVKVLGMTMPGSFLPQRIRRILEGRPAQRISRVRMVCMSVACATVSAVFATGALDRRMPGPRPAPVVIIPAPPAQAAAVAVRDVAPYDTRPKPGTRAALLGQLQVAPVPPSPATTATAAQDMYKDRRMLVLYFDLEAMPAIDRARAFAAAQEFVRTKMQSSDLLAIMTASDAVKVWQDFTNDRNRLLQTLDQLTADSGPESGAAADVDRQLTRLHTAVNMLGSLQGKKALVYFAEPAARTQSVELQPLIDVAIRANVAFYPVDSRGLVATGGGVEAALGPRAYTIGAEDVLQLWVLQQEGISGQYSVRADGMISVPLVGDIRAAGLTPSQMQAVIADRLEARGIANRPSVTVAVVTVGSRRRQNP